MKFKIVDTLPATIEKETIYLVNNSWDDWFEFETVYIVHYQRTNIGGIKIGRKGQTERRAALPAEFSSLPHDYFSLGTYIDYYTNLNKLECRENILVALRDIAYDLQLFNEVCAERVTRISLLREISPNMVRGQLHRIADGGAPLTNYDFKYILPDKEAWGDEYQHLDFHVDIKHKTPPSNIHVLIGNNGIGKTTILKGMIHALIEDSDFTQYGTFETDWSENFSNIVHISFSAFDMPLFPKHTANAKLPYVYVGLMKLTDSSDGKVHLSIKNRKDLSESFFENYYNIITCQKKTLWERSIDILEVDTTFQDLNLKTWKKIDDTAFKKYICSMSPFENETDSEFKKRIHKQYYQERVSELFNSLSSGHKNILLTLASLVE